MSLVSSIKKVGSDIICAFKDGTSLKTTITESGFYTPTLDNTTQVDASTPFKCHWARVGKSVTVSGIFNMDPSASGATTMTMTVPSGMPISADSTVPAGGVASNKLTSVDVLGIDKASATTVAIRGNPVTRTNATYAFIFMYRMD